MASPLDIVRSVLQKAKLGTQLNKPLISQVLSPKVQQTFKPVTDFVTNQVKQNYQNTIQSQKILQKSAKVGWKNLPAEERKFAIEESGGTVFGLLDAPTPKTPINLKSSIIPTQPKGVGGAAKTTSVLEDIYKGFGDARQATKQTQKATKGTFGQQVRTQFLDKLTPIFDLTKLSSKEIATSDNPYKQMRLLSGLSGKTEAIVNQGLKPILQRNADKLDDLSALLVLERENELVGRGLTRARDASKISQGMQELQQKYGEIGFTKLRKSADEIRQFGNRMLDDLFGAGIIDQESFKTIRQNNQFYVPFEIVENIADKLEKSDFSRASFNVASQDVIKSIGSTTKEVGNPLEALLRKVTKVTALVEKNKAMQKLANLRNVDPEVFGDLIKPVTGELPKNSAVINMFENGKNVRYAVPDVIERAVKGLDAETSGILVKLLSPQAKLLRMGATGLNVGFIPANIVRDISDAILTEASENGVRGVASLLSSYPRAIFTATFKKDLYQQWLMAGGAQSTLTEQIFKKGPKALQELAGNRSVIKRILTSPKVLVEFANRVGEQSTRVARFKSGLARGENVAEAAFKSRDITLDFAKSGNTIKVLNQVIPFLNAGIQGSEKLLRLYKNNPRAAVMYSALLYGVPSVALYKHNSQFQDFTDIPESERQVYWIIMGSDRTEEERANGDKIHGIKIPKGFLGRAVAGLTDSTLDFMKQRDPQAFTTFLAETAESISPVGLPIDRPSLGRTLSTILPPGIQAGVEVATNRNLFFDQPIIPRSLEGVAPAEQYKDSTTPVAKAAGRVLGVSPLQIENAVSTMTGGLGRQAMQLASGDIKEATAGQITRRFSGIRSGRETDKEFDEVAKYAEKSKTESLNRKRKAESLVEEFKQMPKNDLRVVLARLKKTDVQLYDKVVSTIKEEALGLSSLERYVNSLGVTDGSRAAYIADRLKKTGSKEEKIALLRDWRSKKIISDTVLKQLVLLMKGGE